MLNQITPLILTYNEEANIARTLSKLTWARNVVIVDSNSSDGTRAAAVAQHPGVKWFDRAFTQHSEQWNFGLEQTGIETEWVLALDADFVLTDALVDELARLAPDPDVGGYEASFVYCISGEPLRGAAYPPVVVLYRRAAGKYHQDGHTQRVRVAGAVKPLLHPILHDDRKPLSRWIASQIQYMRLEAEKLESTPASELTLADRARRMIVVAPPLMFLYCLIAKGGILDGWRGVYYALQRTTAELILSLNIIDRLVHRNDRHSRIVR